MAKIVASTAALADLEKILRDSTEHYFQKVADLEDLVTEITSGPLKGDLADSIKTKYEEKKEAFDEIGKAIQAATDGATAKGKEFASMMEDVKSSMS